MIIHLKFKDYEVKIERGMEFLSEYVLSINKRVMNRPLVIEEKRINLEEE